MKHGQGADGAALEVSGRNASRKDGGGAVVWLRFGEIQDDLLLLEERAEVVGRGDV